jgi:transposase
VPPRDVTALLAEKDAEIVLLRAEIAGLREHVGTLLAEMARLAEVNGTLTERVAELIATVAKSNDRIAELLAAVERKKAAAATKSKPPETPPVVEGEAKEAFDGRPTPPPEGLLHDKPQPKHLPTGRKPLPARLPRDTATVYPERCACGCEQFDWVDEVVEEKLHVQAHQRVRRTVRKTGRCRACNARTTAEAPPSPFERSKVTPEWLAWCVAQKFELHVTLDRLRRSLTAQGLPVAISFLVAQIEAAADLLAGIDGEHWKQLLAGEWMATDGTGIKVQVPGVGLHHGYFEVYHRDDLVVLQYEAEKGGETQAGKLAKFEGALLIDAESRYNETFRRHSGIVEFNCNAHPRRKLRDAETVQPILAAEAGAFVSAMFAEEARAQEEGLTGDALREWRQTRIRPIYEKLGAWMDAVEPTLTPRDPLAKVIRYYRNHWGPLTAFLSNPNIPIDNSASEREFQAVAKLRLNSLFAGGTEGAHRAAVLLGIVATCKRVGIDVQGYLAWVFIRSGTHRAKYNLRAADLTPAAYKRSLAMT